MGPTVVQIKAAQNATLAATYLKDRTYTSSGLLVNEYRNRQFEAWDKDGNLVRDKYVA